VPPDLLGLTVFTLACFPPLYYLFALDTARRFLPPPRPANSPGELLPVSVLKPVRGLDRDAHDHFTSFCRQSYPEFEILFAVADADDPAVPVINRLIEEFPGRAIRLVIGGPHIGPNSKVDKLCWLAREARHELLVVSDSDVTAPPGYLRALAERFRDPRVGLVTCLYRGASDGSLTSDLEAIGISTDFVPGVLVARRLEGMRFALGATMAVRRSTLAEIGGFEALVEYCADDYELGRRVAATGHRVELSTCIVSTACAAKTMGEYLKHQLRWAVTIRHARPWGYIGRLLTTQGLPTSLAAAIVAQSAVAAIACLSIYVALRLALAWTTAVRLDDEVVRRRLWLVPVWDAVAFGVGVAALVTNRIDWRGRFYELQRGKLVVLHRS
jgi:ceramide glucosyltransferase